MAIALSAQIEQRPLKTPLRITGHYFDTFDLLYVELRDGPHLGRGEAWGVYFAGETAASMRAQVESVADHVRRGATRTDLLNLLPAGGARNALDCAMWELEARRSSTPIAALAGLRGTRAVQTMYTISADTPARMAQSAREFGPARTLKLKLTGEAEDRERIEAVRAARPDVALAVDANQGFTPEGLVALAPTLLSAKVELIEQPFPVGREADLDRIRIPIPIAADESACDIPDLAALVGRAQVINIKLDKCGGLTRGLQMAEAAHRLGFDLMVGCMLGTSLGAAPGFILAQRCHYVDLDLVLRCARDREYAVRYERGWLSCDERVWGCTSPP